MSNLDSLIGFNFAVNGQGYGGVVGSTATPVDLDTFSSDPAEGIDAWSNPQNAAVDDGSYAVATGYSAQWLKGVLTPSLRISPDSIIAGIEVVVNAFVFWLVTDSIKASLVFNSVIVGGTVTVPTGTSSNDQYLTLGNSGYLWGLDLTVDDINYASFGCAIRDDSLFNTDKLSIVIHHTPGSMMMTM